MAAVSAVLEAEGSDSWPRLRWGTLGRSPTLSETLFCLSTWGSFRTYVWNTRPGLSVADTKPQHEAHPEQSPDDRGGWFPHDG